MFNFSVLKLFGKIKFITFERKEKRKRREGDGGEGVEERKKEGKREGRKAVL